MNSKQKGARGEREFASFCREQGYECRRGQQYSGIEGEDVVGLPGVHIEVKRVERFGGYEMYDALTQAERDAQDKIPIVAHKKNHCKWVVIMSAEDWFKMYREFRR